MSISKNYILNEIKITEYHRFKSIRNKKSAYNKELQTNLAKNEVFTFTPVLVIEGAMEMKYLKKGIAQVYKDIVFQMTI